MNFRNPHFKLERLLRVKLDPKPILQLLIERTILLRATQQNMRKLRRIIQLQDEILEERQKRVDSLYQQINSLQTMTGPK